MAKKMGATTPLPTPTVPSEAPQPPAVEGDVYDYAALADAPNTQRSYVSDWKHFVAWCQVRRLLAAAVSPRSARDLRQALRRGARAQGLNAPAASGRHQPGPPEKRLCESHQGMGRQEDPAA